MREGTRKAGGAVYGGRCTAIDLFSGCGGLTLGLKQAGFDVVGAVEIDALAVETYRANHPEVQVWHNDVKAVSPRAVMRALGIKKGELDLLAGCPPCQGFSRVRTRNGRRRPRDKRNDLLLEFVRFVEAMVPKAVMMENVPRLAGTRLFREFRSRLRKLGYEGGHRVLNAADYAVPQRRRRLIYLAGLGGGIAFAEPSAKRVTVRDAIAHLPKPGASGDPVHDFPENRTAKVAELIRSIPKDGGSRSDLGEERQLKCHRNCDGFKDIYGRMTWDEVAPTITGGCFNPSKGRFLHPTENRAITMREAALLQGFPRSYKFPNAGSKTAVAEMIGNALPPPFIARLARPALLRGGTEGTRGRARA